METITPFYEEGNYRLQCGLTDSDTVRDHLIDSRYVQRKDHLLWFDMPNEPDYFEEKVKGGTSRFNQAELTMVKNLLMDLEQATDKAKNEGRMKQEDKKSVGVISFYGEQVKRIDRLIQQELNPTAFALQNGISGQVSRNGNGRHYFEFRSESPGERWRHRIRKRL